MTEKKTLLLHVCCAPCATYVVQELKASSFTLKALFYNPNIHPEKEYRVRLAEVCRYASLIDLEITEGQYEQDAWFRAVKGYEAEAEGAKRCEICFFQRLEKTAILAKETGCNFFATTLTVGPAKDAHLINRVGEMVAEEYGIRFFNADFKKRDGFKKSCELSKQFDLYRQNYCG